MGLSMIIEMMKTGLNINKYVIRIRKEFIWEKSDLFVCMTI